MAFKRTVNIHVGNKMSGKSRDEVLEAVLSLFGGENISAVQQAVDVIRVTFKSETLALNALQGRGVRLFGLWCKMDGGPPITIIHLFDFPLEGTGDEAIKEFFGQYGQVRDVRHQRYLRHANIFTGTRLVDVVLEKFPPRLVSVNAHICRVWFKGQPIICNVCGVEGHKAVDCPDRDKCRRCGEHGHLARTCRNAWGTNPPRPTGASEGPVPPRASPATEAPAAGGASSEEPVAPSQTAPGASAEYEPAVHAESEPEPVVRAESGSVTASEVPASAESDVVSTPMEPDTVDNVSLASGSHDPSGSVNSSPEIGEFSSSGTSSGSISECSVEVLEEGLSDVLSSHQPLFRQKDKVPVVPTPSLLVRTFKRSKSMLLPSKRLTSTSGVTPGFHSKIPRIVSDRPRRDSK